MNEYPALDRLGDQLDAVRAEFQQIVDKFGDDESTWPAGQVERKARLSKQEDRLMADYNLALDRAEQVAAVRAAAKDPKNREAGFAVPGSDTATGNRRFGDDDRGLALRAIDGGLGGTSDEGRETVARALDEAHARGDHEEVSALSRWALAAGDDNYRTAFAKLWRDPEFGHREFSAAELDAYQRAQQVSRAMNLGSSSAGSAMLPTHLDPAIIITGAGVIDPVRSVCRVEVIATQTWHGVTAAQVAMSWDGEAAQVSDDTPSFGAPAVKTHKIQGWLQASIEALEDTAFGSQVGGLFSDALSNALGAALTTGAGDGSNQPTGFITALDGGSSEVAPTTAETYGRLDPRKLQEALPARYRANAKFMANLAVLNLTRDFPLLASGTEVSLVDDSGPIPRVHGWELIENSSMDGAYNAAATADNFLLVAGDWKHYLCVTRVGSSIEFVPHVFGANGRPSGERGYYFYARVGGDVLVDDAFRVLNVATTA
jgi:HK97 family phage major capsid protein